MVTYGEVRLAEELQFSVYNFEDADVPSFGSTSDSTKRKRTMLLKRANALMASETASAVEKKRVPICWRRMNWL